jgi:hypothetical protein
MFHERKGKYWKAYVSEERIEDAKKSLTAMKKQPSYFFTWRYEGSEIREKIF